MRVILQRKRLFSVNILVLLIEVFTKTHFPDNSLLSSYIIVKFKWIIKRTLCLYLKLITVFRCPMTYNQKIMHFWKASFKGLCLSQIKGRLPGALNELMHSKTTGNCLLNLCFSLKKGLCIELVYGKDCWPPKPRPTLGWEDNSNGRQLYPQSGPCW